MRNVECNSERCGDETRSTVLVCSKILGALVMLSVTTAAQAACIMPVGYTAPVGQVDPSWPYFTYYDDTGNQLTDGILGNDIWFADLGHGPAYEWVGWLSVDPTITFNFGAPVTINEVLIGFNRTQDKPSYPPQNVSSIYLPSLGTIGSSVFTLMGDEITDGTRGFLSFPVSFTGSTLNVGLADANDGRWIFVDEIQFFGVPEPSTLVVLVIGAISLLAYVCQRRRQTA